MEETDVVICGGGLAGLSAAIELAKANIKFLVLEAADRAGGRAFSISMKTSGGRLDRFDMGGQWIGKTQIHLKSLLDELNIKTYPQYTAGTKLLQLGNRKLRHYSSSLPSLSSVGAYVDFFQSMIRIENMVQKVDPFNPAACSNVDVPTLDSCSLKAFCEAVTFDEETRDAFDVATRVVSGAPLSTVSAMYFLIYAATANGYLNLLDTEEDGAQAERVDGTIGGAVERIVGSLGQGAVKTGVPVRRVTFIEGDAGAVGAIVETDSFKVRAKYVIVAVPPQKICNIEFSPPLPFWKREVCGFFAMGNLIKFVATYENSFWREKGFSGEVVCFSKNVAETGKPTAAFLVFDATTSNGSPALVGFIPNEWADAAFEERRRAVIHDLARYFGDEAKQFIDYADKDWSLESTVGGCPAANLPPGHVDNFARAMRQPIGPIHWAGTETATHWMGYLSGAVQSGRRAANEVVYNLRPNTLPPENLEDTWYARPAEDPVIVMAKRVKQVECRRTQWKIVFTVISLGLIGGAVYYKRQQIEDFAGQLLRNWKA